MQCTEEKHLFYRVSSTEQRLVSSYNVTLAAWSILSLLNKY